MGFNEFLSSVFGNKSTRDMKEIKPWVEKIKAAYQSRLRYPAMHLAVFPFASRKETICL